MQINGLNLNLEFLVFTSLTLWLSILSFFVYRMRKESKNLSDSLNSGEDVVSLLEKALEKVKKAERRTDDLAQDLEDLNRLGEGYVQKVGFSRYNPYNETGGDQSFVLALLNARGDGVVVSSLHNRGNTRVYAKEVLGAGESKHPLSKEEEEVIKKAMEEN